MIAAAAVIYGHSYAISGIPGAADHIARQGWGHGLYSGSIAVQVFFAISGFLVTGAWLRRPDAAYLPADWPGVEAEGLFAELDQRLRSDAHDHAMSLVHG